MTNYRLSWSYVSSNVSLPKSNVSLPKSNVSLPKSNVSLPVSINCYRLNDDVVVILFATYLVYIVRL